MNQSSKTASDRSDSNSRILMDGRHIAAISPIPLNETRSKFARRLQESRQRGQSPLVRRTNSDPSLNKSADAETSSLNSLANDETSNVEFLSGISSAEGWEENSNCLIASSTSSIQWRTSPRPTDSGYSSARSKLTQIREDLILESTGNGEILLGGSSSTSCVEELKRSQLQGTSTPRTSQGSAIKKTPNRSIASEKRDNSRPSHREHGNQSKSGTGVGGTSTSSASAVGSNPFDSFLTESLTQHTFSPSVFKRVVSPSSQHDTPTSGFRWSIDHIAVLNPAEIDEFPFHQSILENQCDPAQDAEIQRVLETWWASQKYIAPSPKGQDMRARILSEQADSPSYFSIRDGSPAGGISEPKKPSRTTETQTLMTFPPDLDLVKLLGNVFTFNEETGERSENSDAAVNLSLNSLRRKLFAGSKTELRKRSSLPEPEDTSTLDSTASSVISATDDRPESPVFFEGGHMFGGEISFAGADRRGSMADGAGMMKHFISPEVSPIRNFETMDHRSRTDSLDDISMLNSTECDTEDHEMPRDFSMIR